MVIRFDKTVWNFKILGMENQTKEFSETDSLTKHTVECNTFIEEIFLDEEYNNKPEIVKRVTEVLKKNEKQCLYEEFKYLRTILYREAK